MKSTFKMYQVSWKQILRMYQASCEQIFGILATCLFVIPTFQGTSKRVWKFSSFLIPENVFLPSREINVSKAPSFVWANFSHVQSFVCVNFPHLGSLKMRFCPVVKSSFQMYQASCEQIFHVNQASCDQIFRILVAWKRDFCWFVKPTFEGTTEIVRKLSYIWGMKILFANWWHPR